MITVTQELHIKQIKKNTMQTITKEFKNLSDAINYVRILKKYSSTVKMKSKGNIYIYTYGNN